MSTLLNWGSSYFVNDFYKRFIKKSADEKHYVKVARIVSFALAGCAMVVAFLTESIGSVFTFVLSLTAAIGPVYFLRWFWWRINATSEIAAMAVSLPVILARAWVFKTFHVPDIFILQLLFMILGSALFWVPATYLTKPESEETLDHFQQKVRPPGVWLKKIVSDESWMPSIKLWLVSTAALLTLTVGPLKWILGQTVQGMILTGISAVLWIYVVIGLRKSAEKPEEDLCLTGQKK